MGIRKENPLSDPRYCTYKLSGSIRGKVEKLTHSEDVEEATKKILIDLMNQEEANKNTLTYDSLTKMHKYIQRADPDYIEPFYLFSEKCKRIDPKPRENKQLDARLKILRLRSSQAEYNSMTAAVDRLVENKMEKLADSDDSNSTSKVYSNLNNTDGQSHMSEFKKLNGPMVAVFNSFLVFICTFIFCYKALEYAMPRPNIIAQVLFGLAGSTIVAIAELYFLLRVV